uniref:Breast cancer anti-estrogen resistance protein 1 n=1 Tax=Nothoprocta perdicaria TaxID=30464 RepID=A0A8C6ZHX1_NOTPE
LQGGLNLMARALYDNVPECAEELAFRKGDILTVIEQNTEGLEGWWLCSLHGRQGIVPGNRVKLLIGPVVQDGPSAQDMSNSGLTHPSFNQQKIYQVPSSHAVARDPVYQVPPSHLNQGIYQIPTSHGLVGHDVYQVPPSMQRSVDSSTPAHKIYDIPPASAKGPTYPDFSSPLGHSARPEGVYDIPPPITKATGKELSQKYSPEGILSTDGVPRKQSVYDIPQIAPQKDVYDTPRGTAFPGQQTGLNESGISEGSEGVYDVPPAMLQDTKGFQDVTDGINRLSFSSTGSTRSNMSTSSTTSKESSFSASTAPDKRLILDPDTAIERLYCLQQMMEAGVGNLMAFVTADWRSYGYLEKHLNDIRAAVDAVERSLVAYLQFARGSAANAACLADGSLYNKMRREVQRLEDSHQILTQTSHDLNSYSWSLNVLAVNRPHNKCDDLDRFVMVARTVPDDAKQLTTTISVNAPALFPPALGGSRGRSAAESGPRAPQSGERSREPWGGPGALPAKEQHPPGTHGESSGKSWMDDYDYVHLQGKEEFERQQKELLEKENIMKQSKMELEHHQINQFQRLEQEITKPVENDPSKWKAPPALQAAGSPTASHDRQLLSFYSEQCGTHHASLLKAIDAFFGCLNAAQPPRIFVAHSKFVILSAHKLVFIGDTLARQASSQDVRNRVMNSSNQLCELLKSIVMATKVAALHYPHTGALQDMVDRVAELSHHAQLFKLSLGQMASL